MTAYNIKTIRVIINGTEFTINGTPSRISSLKESLIFNYFNCIATDTYEITSVKQFTLFNELCNQYLF